MLSDRDCQLLTAYVDGELSTRQRKTALRLLQKSSEARNYLRLLQADADAVRRLPRHHLGRDFPLRVTRLIAERGLQPAAPVVRRSRPGAPAWVGWAAAAAVLVSVSALSYYTFPLLQKGSRKDASVAAKTPPEPSEPRQKRSDKSPPKDRRKDNSSLVKKEREVAPPFNPMVFLTEGKAADGPAEVGPKPAPKKDPPKGNPDGILTAPDKGDLPPVVVPNLSVMMPLQDLDRAEDKDRLLAKLGRDNAYHVQLLCRNTAAAFAKLRQALDSHGLRLFIDRAARARLGKPRLRTNYVLYSESLKAGELLAVLQHLSRTDRAIHGKKPAPRQFGYLVVNAMSRNLRQHVVKFLGKESGGKGTQRQALVLAYNEDNSAVNPRPSRSREVKQFRQHRGERRGNTLQIILALRRE
jgi:hypothetical protein